MDRTQTLTMTFRVDVDPDVEVVLERWGRECANWMTKVFRVLYTKRIQKAGAPWDAMTIKKKNGSFCVNDTEMYPAFIRKSGHLVDIPCDIVPARYLQCLIGKVGTSWCNFLNPNVPKPRNGRLPRFRPEVHVRNQCGAKLTAAGLSFTDPFQPEKRLNIRVVPSKDQGFRERYDLLAWRFGRGGKNHPSFSLKQIPDARGGKFWTLFVPIDGIPVPPGLEGHNVLGMDVGARVLATTATYSPTDMLPEGNFHGPAIPAYRALEKVQKRVRGLRSAADRGSAGARRALKRLKNKKRRLNKTLTDEASAHIVQEARAANASVVAMEDLTKLKVTRSGGKSNLPKEGKFRRKFNRLVSQMPRSQLQEKVRYKVCNFGIRTVDVDHRGTSTICPVWYASHPKARSTPENPLGKQAEADGHKYVRDFKTHASTCACGYTNNDDKAAAVAIAIRGWRMVSSSPDRKSSGDGKDSAPPRDPLGPVKGAARGHTNAAEVRTDGRAAKGNTHRGQSGHRSISADTRPKCECVDSGGAEYAALAGSDQATEPSTTQRPISDAPPSEQGRSRKQNGESICEGRDG